MCYIQRVYNISGYKCLKNKHILCLEDYPNPFKALTYNHLQIINSEFTYLIFFLVWIVAVVGHIYSDKHGLL